MPRTDAVRDWDGWSAPPVGPCAQCGVDASQAPPDDLGPAILAVLPRWAVALMRPGVGGSAGPLTWSVLERAVHVRDLFGAVAGWLGRMLHEDDPLLEDWSGHRAPTRDGAPDPVRVAVELEDAGRAVAARLSALARGPLAHRAHGPDGPPVTVLSLGRYLVHDVVHHLHDVNAWQPPDEWLAPDESYPQKPSTGL